MYLYHEHELLPTKPSIGWTIFSRGSGIQEPLPQTTQNNALVCGAIRNTVTSKAYFLTPITPQHNGEMDRQNRSLLKRLKICHAMKGNWKSDLRHYLTMYYTTLHSVTGKTPMELRYGRSIVHTWKNSIFNRWKFHLKSVHSIETVI